MNERFKQTIKDATVDGLMQRCQEKLESAARGSNWYAAERNRIDAKTFDSIREDIDAAEALWEAARTPTGDSRK